MGRLGTIPFLVYWGIRLVRPELLALTAFLATALMSMFTGTSWGSAGTVGVALMGMAAALDVPLAATVAGAVVSGAYFGDKMSPLSDLTNIAAIAANVPICIAHIRHLIYTAIPSFVIACLVVFTRRLAWLPTGALGSELPDSARVLLADLDRAFSLSWLMLLPPAIAVSGASCAACRRRSRSCCPLWSRSIIGVVLQGFGVGRRSHRPRSRASARSCCRRSASLQRTGSARTSSGSSSAAGSTAWRPTLIVIVAAFLLAAAMEVSGALDLLIRRLLDSARIGLPPGRVEHGRGRDAWSR